MNLKKLMSDNGCQFFIAVFYILKRERPDTNVSGDKFIIIIIAIILL